MKVLMLEGINTFAEELFKENHFDVEYHKKGLTEVELIEKIKDVHLLCIRSKTQVNKVVLQNAENLLAIGCFGIGTNQVDTKFARNMGIPVFNDLYSSTRSVAEMVIANVISLSRKIGDKNNEMHNGKWMKTSAHCNEIRNKTIGIVGYNHIGTQVSTMAESLGMKVLFYDIMPVMSYGNAKRCSVLTDLLTNSDYVTLHVPLTKGTKHMINKDSLLSMKEGSYLINASRGEVVNMTDLQESLENNHLGGVSLDVYPVEPKTNGDFTEYMNLAKCNNVIMTPHMGGSTEEAQYNISCEVSNKLLDYYFNGKTIGAVNFPKIFIDEHNAQRIVSSVHYNQKGALSKIVNVINDNGYNIESQNLGTVDDIGYCLFKLNKNELSPTHKLSDFKEVIKKINDLDISVATRSV
jgi:D-3-phosphoglycerate dehydrogenase / 2-oxoglutarate reductase